MSVKFSVISQKNFSNKGHHPWNKRRIVFQMVNNRRSPIIVYGFKFDNEFDPGGYILEFDDKKGEWLYPTPDNRAITWGETSDLDKAKYLLRPGKAIKFVAEMSEFEVGRRFRRIVFTITVLSQRLDYLRIRSAIGYDVDQFEIENLRKEIEAEEEELRRIRESAA